MGNFIEIQVSKKLFYPFGMAFFSCFSYTFNCLIKDHLKKNSKNEEQETECVTIVLIEVMALFLGNLLIGFIYLIYKCINKGPTNKDNFLPRKENNTLKKIFYTWTASLLDFLCTITLYYFWFTQLQGFEVALRGFMLFIAMFLCFICLKYKYYCHHFLGIGLISFGVLISLMSLKHKKNGFDRYLIGGIIIFQIAACSLEIIEKKMMEKLFSSPYKILFFEGIIGCILTSAFAIGFWMYNKEDSIMEVFEGMKDLYFVVIFLGKLINSLFFNITRIMTNYEFSPTHRAVPDDLAFFLTYFFSKIFLGNESELKIYYVVVSCFLMMCGVLIFHELIILKFCNLDINTNKIISERGNIDIKSTLNEENTDSGYISEEAEFPKEIIRYKNDKEDPINGDITTF